MRTTLPLLPLVLAVLASTFLAGAAAGDPPAAAARKLALAKPTDTVAAPDVPEPGEEHLASDEVPELHEPFPWNHDVHDKALRKVGLRCVDCHPVGLEAGAEPPSLDQVVDPRRTCHGCHRAKVAGAPRKAPSACETCHAEREQLMPADHGPLWTREHGLEARRTPARCQDCHGRAVCLDCHENRGALERSPHLPGFGNAHGVEARLDPQSCSLCHAGESCLKCHEEGVRPW